MSLGIYIFCVKKVIFHITKCVFLTKCGVFESSISGF